MPSKKSKAKAGAAQGVENVTASLAKLSVEDTVDEPAQERSDAHAQRRARALELALPAGLDGDAEKRFKLLQKKLREIGKLHAAEGTLEKLQLQKLTTEPALLDEIEQLRAQAPATPPSAAAALAAAAPAAAAAAPASSSASAAASAAAPKPTQKGAEDPKNVHLEQAIFQGLIEERREKYLNKEKWHATFCGTFRVNPPKRRIRHQDRDMAVFEYFLWSDIKPQQPTFESLKQTIARTVGVKTSDFYFETMTGAKLDRSTAILDAYNDLVKSSGTKFEQLAGKSLVDIRIVAAQ
eukprot:TRINITY_DN42645_c0_g1_i1.p1 TRINITY_DN42645_c0_g1~~TRINITY_DN42645_c0_g1_i1.p1  ORF type:complete len:340 (+),score=103.55 TRINITY_DN42645_c0_g1_i1:136-1020(+)